MSMIYITPSLPLSADLVYENTALAEKRVGLRICFSHSVEKTPHL